MQKEFTTPFEEISLQELNKCLQKFYFSQENAMAIWWLHAKIVTVGNSKSLKNHHFCAQLSHCYFCFVAQ